MLTSFIVGPKTVGEKCHKYFLYFSYLFLNLKFLNFCQLKKKTVLILSVTGTVMDSIKESFLESTGSHEDSTDSAFYSCLSKLCIFIIYKYCRIHESKLSLSCHEMSIDNTLHYWNVTFFKGFYAFNSIWIKKNYYHWSIKGIMKSRKRLLFK